MDFRQTLLLYLLIGAGVAIGYAARSSDKGRAWATILAAWVFWPLFVPLLLSVDDEEIVPPTLPDRECLLVRIARGRELLDQLAASGPELGIPLLAEQAAHIKSRWSERAAWLAETDLLVQSLNTTIRDPSKAQTPQIEELQFMQQSTKVTLQRSLVQIDELAVWIQLLKAPGVDRASALERIEAVLRAIQDLESRPGPATPTH